MAKPIAEPILGLDKFRLGIHSLAGRSITEASFSIKSLQYKNEKRIEICITTIVDLNRRESEKDGLLKILTSH